MNANADTPATKPDPDNVFISQGRKDPSKAYVFVPFSYRDAHAALKQAGARFMGSQWEIDGEALKASEAKIREAARRDIALGAEGRKARENELKAAAAASSGKQAGEKAREKAGKSSPDEAGKPAGRRELTDEERAARAERTRAAVIERDATRIPVIAGEVEEGDTVEIDGREVEVTRVGGAFTIDAATAADLEDRFPSRSFKAGDSIAYASFEAPAVDATAEKEPEAAGDAPSM